MKAQIYFANLKRAITGTTVGASNALDVNVVQSVVPGAAGLEVLETRFHDCSVTNIQAVGGSFVEIETAAALANTISKMKVSCTFGEPISIRKAANAGAAAAAADIALLNQGQSADFEVSLLAGDKLWVRSRTATLVNSGYLTVNLIG